MTNTHNPGKVSVTVTKAWADGNNQDGLRPDKVTVKLLANGKETGETLVLNKANNWTGTFTDLDEKASGEVIEYTVEEVEVEGYETAVTGNAKEG